MSVFSNDEGIFQVRADKARRNRLEAIEYLKNDYRSIAQIMGQYYPPAILSKAVWHTYEVEQKSRADEMEKATARLFPVLLQSIFISRYFDLSTGFSSRQEIKDRDWDRLVSLVDDASRRYMRLIDARAIVALDEGQITKDDFFSYREALFTQLYSWQMTNEELVESKELFKNLFVDDEELCQEVFKTDSATLLGELYKVSTVCTNGIDELVQETRELNAELKTLVDAKQAEKPQLTRQLASDEVLSSGNYRQRLQRLSDKANSYDLFSVEFNSLLSTASCIPLSTTAATLDDVIYEDRLAAVSYPIIRFADRFYTFVGPTFHTAVVHALRHALQKGGMSATEGGNKLEKLYNNYILYLFRGETDGTEDYYTYRDYKADVVLLSSLKHMNAYRYPGIYSTRRARRVQEEATKNTPGRVMLLVDPDGTAPLEEIAPERYTISLSEIARISADEKTYDAFFVQLFKLTEADEEVSEEEEELAEAFVEDDEENTESFDVVDDEIPAQVLLDDEMEYDSEDDDEKAREIEARFDQEDAFLPDDEPLPAPSPADPSAYELPEELAEEPIVEELEDIDDEDLIGGGDEDDSSLDDGLDDEEEEEEAEWEDIMPIAFDDDDVADEDEEEGADDQLSLFDDDGNPSYYYPEDELADLDTIPDDTSEIRAEDGPVDEDSSEEESEEPTEDIDGLPSDSDDETTSDDTEEPEDTTSEEELDDAEEDIDDLVEEDGEEPLDDAEEETGDLEAEDGTSPEMEEEETISDSTEEDLDDLVDEDGEEPLEDSEEETECLEAEDGTSPAEDSSEEAPAEELSSDDGNAEPVETIEAASEEEEADEAEELPVQGEDDEDLLSYDPEKAEAEEEALTEEAEEPSDQSDDEDLTSYDPEKAEAEEETLASEESEESAEAEDEEAELAEDLAREGEEEVEEPSAEEENPEADDSPSDETDKAEEDAPELARDYARESEEADDEDALVEDEAPYGVETAFTEKKEEVTYDSEDDEPLLAAAEDEDELVRLPKHMSQIRSKLDRPLPALDKFLTSVPPQTLDSFESALERSITASRSEGRDKMLVIPDFRLSFVITSSDRLDALRKMEVGNNAGAQMYARGFDEWSFALLSYNSREELNFVYSDTVTEKSFSPSDWKIVRIMGQELKRKIGR